MAGIKNQSEAELLIKSGFSHLGYPLRLPVNVDDTTEEEAAIIISKTAKQTTSVWITYEETADEIIKFCNKLKVKTVQLHGDISIVELKKLRELSPDFTIFKSLVVREGNSEQLMQLVKETTNYIDAFITDTFDPATGASGATGKTHDWAISEKLVKISAKPIILAGGLNADNVYDAIIKVKPAGVDVHTGIENIDGWKDPSKSQQFVENATAAFQKLALS